MNDLLFFPVTLLAIPLADGGSIALIILFWVVVGLSIAGVTIYLTSHFEKKRTEAMTPVAASLGMEFSAEADDSLLQVLEVFKLFNRGHSRKMRNVMKAETDSAQLAVFDYRFTTGHGKHQTVHKQTVFSMKTSELNPPQFLLRPEGFLDKVGSIVGGQDIDFDSHPLFSKQFVLQGDNEEEVRRFFDAELLEYFEKNEGLYVESAPGMFIFFHRKLNKPDQIRGLMDQGYAAYAAVAERLSRQ